MKLIANEFGFCDTSHFFNSLIKPQLLNISIPIAAIGGFLSMYFGIQPVVFAALAVLLTLELISGISASKMEGKKITSKRMKSFPLMMLTWMSLLFILHSFEVHFENNALEFVFCYLHSALLLFINIIYIKSILENVSRIMNKKSEFKSIIDIFNKKLNP